MIPRKPQSGASLLKPFERVISRTQRKRPAVVLDKCDCFCGLLFVALEIPLSGMILTRTQLKEMLITACSKRQRINHHELLLLDMHTTSTNGYSTSLEAFMSSKQTVKLNMTALPEFDDMSFDAPMDMSMDDGNVTLDSIHNIDQEPIAEPHPIDQTDEVEQANEELLAEPTVVEKMEYPAFISSVKTVMEEKFMEEGKRELSWNAFTAKDRRHECAEKFYNLLIAASQQDLQVAQQQPYCDITVSL